MKHAFYVVLACLMGEAGIGAGSFAFAESNLRIATPEDGSFVQDVVTITGQFDEGPVHLTLYDENRGGRVQPLAAADRSPLSYTWNTRDYPDSRYRLTLESGAVRESIVVFVLNNPKSPQPPQAPIAPRVRSADAPKPAFTDESAQGISIKLVAPVEGDIVSGDLYNLRARLTPSTPEAHEHVMRVYFWAQHRPPNVDGVSAAFEYENGVYHGTWDTTRFKNGPCTLGVWLYNKRNRVIAQDEVTAIVKNAE